MIVSLCLCHLLFQIILTVVYIYWKMSLFIIVSLCHVHLLLQFIFTFLSTHTGKCCFFLVPSPIFSNTKLHTNISFLKCVPDSTVKKLCTLKFLDSTRKQILYLSYVISNKEIPACSLFKQKFIFSFRLRKIMKISKF